MSNENVHENETYAVRVLKDKSGYLLYNKLTDVIEEESIGSLPNAISVAEQSNAYLHYNTWQWIRKQEETNNDIAESHLELHDLEIN